MDGHQVDLVRDANTITVPVSRPGLITRTYTITLNRLRAGIESVALTNDPGWDDTYAAGDEIEVTLTFNGPVAVDTTKGVPLVVVLAENYDRRSTFTSIDTTQPECYFHLHRGIFRQVQRRLADRGRQFDVQWREYQASDHPLGCADYLWGPGLKPAASGQQETGGARGRSKRRLKPRCQRRHLHRGRNHQGQITLRFAGSGQHRQWYATVTGQVRRFGASGWATAGCLHPVSDKGTNACCAQLTSQMERKR